jgi:hypothetical protein
VEEPGVEPVLPDRLYTRRQWLMREAIINGAAGDRGGIISAFAAREAVASVGLEHPEWDMDGERRTWAGWALEDGWGDL